MVDRRARACWDSVFQFGKLSPSTRSRSDRRDRSPFVFHGFLELGNAAALRREQARAIDYLRKAYISTPAGRSPISCHRTKRKACRASLAPAPSL